MMPEPLILADDTLMLVVDKPAGLIVHSDGRTEEPSLADWILDRYPELAKVGEPWVSPQGETILRPGLVQRLDRTTSGVMIVAKTKEMWMHLKKEFKERRVEKTYRAFVYGHMESDSGKIVSEIARTSEPPRKWFAKRREETHVRAVITEWSLLKRMKDQGEPISYIEARPKTGRTHQIRVHFASIGHPLIADHVYAPDKTRLLNFARPALHAYSISFTLPSGDHVSFEAPLPLDFQNAGI